jgi:hypothetical protein
MLDQLTMGAFGNSQQQVSFCLWMSIPIAFSPQVL